MNRVEQMIEDKYPGQLESVKRTIESMSKEYDFNQFHEDDIFEDILLRLNII